MKFRAHNIRSLNAVYPFYKDQAQRVSMAKQARDELTEMFARDAEVLDKERSKSWD